MNLISAIILKFPKGYVAELRFKDKTKDCSLSGDTKDAIYKNIERAVSGK